MVGLPGQTKAEILQTIEEIEKLNLDMFTINIFDPPPSSEIYASPTTFGLRELTRDLEGRKVLESSELSRKEILQLASFANKKLNHDKVGYKISEIKNLLAFS
jgi:hypothetical protein